MTVVAARVIQKKERVFTYICTFKREHDGLPPTVREIRDSTGLSSTSVAAYYVDMLIGEGRLYALGDGVVGRSRSFGVTGGVWSLASEASI